MIDMNDAQSRFALDAVREAAQLSQRVRTGMAMQNIVKSDFSPVTVADYVVQALVAFRLSEAFPGDLLVAEENAQALRDDAHEEMRVCVTQFVRKVLPDATEAQVCDWIDQGCAAPGKRFWTLDPVDGTKGYMRGGQYAVALALVEDGQVELGALACPNLGENHLPEALGVGMSYIARRGQGAGARCMLDTDGLQPLRVSTCADAAAARLFRSVESGHTNAQQIDEISRAMVVVAEPVMMDSQAKYGTLASGNGELMLRLLSAGKEDYKEKIWDQAAGSILLEEAGGRITDLHGQPLDFSQGRELTRNTGVFASNGPLHEAGLEAIARVCFGA